MWLRLIRTNGTSTNIPVNITVSYRDGENGREKWSIMNQIIMPDRQKSMEFHVTVLEEDRDKFNDPEVHARVQLTYVSED